MNNPNTTVRVNTLKKVRKTWPVDREQSTSARNVVNPPFRTAGPMESTASTVLRVCSIVTCRELNLVFQLLLAVCVIETVQ